MSAPVVTPPERRPLWSDGGPSPALPLGGGTTVGALAATGQLGGDTTTRTTVVTKSASTTALDAEALYAATSAGVVDITADSSTSSQSTATGTGFEVDGQGH